MKLKLSAPEVISVIVLVLIGVLLAISAGLDYHEERKRIEAIDLAYSIMEAGKLAHMNMKKQDTVTFTEESYFDGNMSDHGPYLLTIDKYQNTIMEMWVNHKYCVTKQNNQSELILDDTKKTERECLTKQSNVTDLLSHYDLVEDTEKTGLNMENTFASKKYFTGEDPSNYLIFADHCFRIVHITEGNYLKIVYEGLASTDKTCSVTTTSGSVDDLAFDEANTNYWDQPATLRNVMEIWSNDKNINNVIQTLDTSKLVPAIWYIGELTEDKDLTLQEVIAAERGKVSDKQLYVGLLNISDYMKATNHIDCVTLNAEKTSACRLENYLYKTNTPWFINGSETQKTNVYWMGKQGQIISHNSSDLGSVRPVLYLRNDVTFTGSGRATSPYLIGA